MGDLSVQFADVMRVLRDNKNEWLYVELDKNGSKSKGYVPTSVAVELKQFIQQLVIHHSNLVNFYFSNNNYFD